MSLEKSPRLPEFINILNTLMGPRQAAAWAYYRGPGVRERPEAITLDALRAAVSQERRLLTSDRSARERLAYFTRELITLLLAQADVNSILDTPLSFSSLSLSDLDWDWVMRNSDRVNGWLYQSASELARQAVAPEAMNAYRAVMAYRLVEDEIAPRGL